MNERLDHLLWQDIAILEQPEGKVLILLCKSENQAIELKEYLINHKYQVKSFIVLTDKRHKITLEFQGNENAIGFDTNRTSDQYPPLKWLGEGKVKYLTTGLKLPDKSLIWHTPFLPLLSPSWN